MNYAKFLKRVTIFFVCFLIVLTFFARTLVDINLPRVSTDFLHSGVVRPEAMSSGLVTRSEQIRVFAPASGILSYVLAVGDTVNAYYEEVLFTITTDLDTLVNRLQANEHDRSVNTLALEQANLNLAEAQERLDDLRMQPLVFPDEPVLNIRELEQQIEANARSIATVREDIYTLRVLYGTGAIPRIDITRREADLDSLLVQAENLSVSLDNALLRHEADFVNHRNAVSRIHRERSEQLRSLESVVSGHGFAVARAELDALRIANLHGEIMERILAGGVYDFRKAYGEHESYIVLEVNPAIHEGGFVSENTWVMTLSPMDNNFVVYAFFSHVHEFVLDAREVRLASGERHFDGTITRAQPQGATNMLQVSVNSPFFSGGELVRVTVRGSSLVAEHTVPLVALREDDRGYFILYVASEEARFGNRYIVRAARVTVLERDASIAAIQFSAGVDDVGPVVIRSDVPISPGSRVRLTAPNSFTPAR